MTILAAAVATTMILMVSADRRMDDGDGDR